VEVNTQHLSLSSLSFSVRPGSRIAPVRSFHYVQTPGEVKERKGGSSLFPFTSLKRNTRSYHPLTAFDNPSRIAYTLPPTMGLDPFSNAVLRSPLILHFWCSSLAPHSLYLSSAPHSSLISSRLLAFLSVIGVADRFFPPLKRHVAETTLCSLLRRCVLPIFAPPESGSFRSWSPESLFRRVFPQRALFSFRSCFFS